MADLLAVLVRWIQFFGASLLVGIFSVRWLVVGPTAREGGRDTAAAFTALESRLLTLATGALIATMLAGGLDLWRQASVAADSAPWSTVALRAGGAVLLRTRYGWVWLARHGCLLLLGVWLVLRRRAPPTASRVVSDVTASALAMGGLALVAAASHAASVARGTMLAVMIDGAHLMGTGLWFGGLLPFALGLGQCLRLPSQDTASGAAAATRRFSRLALLSMSVLVGTGAYNAWVQVGSIPGLVGTPYGRWLAVKLGLLLLLLGLAASNRFVVTPRLLAAAATRSAAGPGPTIRRLRRQVLAEVALGAGILGVVAVLGLTTPARHGQPTWPFSFRLSGAALQAFPRVPPEVTTGGALALFGLLVLTAAAFAPDWRARYLAAGGVVGLLVGLAVAVPPLAIDAYPTTYRRPTVPYVTSSIASGAALYRVQCVMCHGVAGHGDGPAAAGLHPRPADLTAPHTGDHTAGDLFWWVTHGIPGTGMPGFGDRLSEGERWDLINFVRALASAEPARLLGPVLASTLSIVAPDLVFSLDNGDTRSLKDYRGTRVVLLVFFTPASSHRLRQLARVYPAFQAASAEIVGLPVGTGRSGMSLRASVSVPFPVAWDVGDDVRIAYGLFRRGVTAEDLGAEPSPRHMELLIDRQGYLRARWIMQDGGGWGDVTRLLAVVRELGQEPPRAPAPDAHVH